MTANHPDKALVRAHMQERAKAKTPPPTPAEIREQLGWRMIQDDKRPDV